MIDHSSNSSPRSLRRWAGAAVVAVLVMLLVAVPARAQERYELDNGQWQKQETFPPDSPEGQLQAVRKLLAEEKGEEAQDAAGAWIKRYPNHPMLVDAYLVRGDARVQQNKEYKSLFDYEYVIRQYPASEQFNVALQREFEIAQMYANGRRRTFLGMRILAAGAEAEEIFIRIQERVPGSEIGEKASMALADYYFRKSEMTSAADAYGLYLLNYPRSQRRERAMLRVIQANLARFKGPKFDSTGLIEAAERIKQYRKEYPAGGERIGADALLIRIDESLSAKMYHTGNWYRDRGRDISAVTMYRRTVRDYPQTAAAKAAIEQLASLKAPVVEEPEVPWRPARSRENETLRISAPETAPSIPTPVEDEP